MKSSGLGRIKQFTDMGENSIVVIKFNSGQTKSLMLKYANLRYLAGDESQIWMLLSGEKLNETAKRREK